jgi:hypothetical protein
LPSFEVNNEHDLYERVKNIEWENLIATDDTIAIDTVLNTEIFNHSQYISQKTKDAICDRFREKSGVRPSVDLDNPTLRLHLHVSKSKCVIALDSSGDSLHKRGYRDKTNLAPINEVLAAGLGAAFGLGQAQHFPGPYVRFGHHTHRSRYAGSQYSGRAFSRAFRFHELETAIALRQRAVGNHLRCGRRTNFDRRNNAVWH